MFVTSETRVIIFAPLSVPEIADRDYRQTPVSLLGARQAVNLAKYAGAVDRMRLKNCRKPKTSCRQQRRRGV